MVIRLRTPTGKSFRFVPACVQRAGGLCCLNVLVCLSFFSSASRLCVPAMKSSGLYHSCHFFTQRFIRSDFVHRKKTNDLFTSKMNDQLFATMYKDSEPQSTPHDRFNHFFHHTCITRIGFPILLVHSDLNRRFSAENNDRRAAR